METLKDYAEVVSTLQVPAPFLSLILWVGKYLFWILLHYKYNNTHQSQYMSSRYIPRCKERVFEQQKNREETDKQTSV